MSSLKTGKPFVIGCVIALLVVISVFAFRPSSVPDIDKPNIVIFIADDLSYDDLPPYGNDGIETPAISALAANGMRFDNVFLTTASCSPSRGSILTGKYPTEHGAPKLHDELASSNKTLAGYLTKAGYYAVSAGKWHIGNVKRQFDKVITEHHESSGAARWVEVVRDRPTNKPFFFWFAAYDPHRPFADQAPDLPPPLDPSDMKIPRGLPDQPGMQSVLAKYYREVERFDRNVGYVVDELKRQGILDNTIIIVMADNGRPFVLAKRSLYDAGIKTPFIMHWPRNIGSGLTNTTLISAIDIVPTLLEVADLPIPTELSGTSFLKALNTPGLVVRDEIFAERNWHGTDAHQRAVRTLSYFYKENQYPEDGECIDAIRGNLAGAGHLRQAYEQGTLSDEYDECFQKDGADVEFYRVGDDGEIIMRNLAQKPELSDVQADLAARLAAWRLSIGDQDYKPSDE